MVFNTEFTKWQHKPFRISKSSIIMYLSNKKQKNEIIWLVSRIFVLLTCKTKAINMKK